MIDAADTMDEGLAGEGIAASRCAAGDAMDAALVRTLENPKLILVADNAGDPIAVARADINGARSRARPIPSIQANAIIEPR